MVLACGDGFEVNQARGRHPLDPRKRARPFETLRTSEKRGLNTTRLKTPGGGPSFQTCLLYDCKGEPLLGVRGQRPLARSTL
jgi:hypothetical protein